MSNKGKFSLALREFAQKAGDRANQACKEVVLEFGSRLIVRSPVDTGRFRGNWFYSFGAVTHQVNNNDLAVAAHIFQAGGVGRPSWTTAVNGLETLPARVVGGIHYLQNNLPYALVLERGDAKRTAHAMVGLTVQDFQGIVDQAAQNAAN
jgi:hypothetical protein